MSLTLPRAFQIGRFLGVPVYLTWSWLLFVGVIVPIYTHQLQRIEPRLSVAIAISLALALMWGLTVLVHEFGHVFAAVRYGARVERVELGFLGGETQIGIREENPTSEFWIAASGPLVSVVLGLPGLVSAVSGFGLGFGLDGTAGLFVSGFTIANLAIAAFNLLPGLPLDGGRILVAALWRGRRDRIAATRLASYGGYAISIALAVAGVAVILTSGGDLAMRMPLMVALIIMSAVLWSMAGGALQDAERERTLASSGIIELIDAVDTVPARIPATDAYRDTISDVVLVHGLPGGPAYVTRGELAAAQDVAPADPTGSVTVGAIAHRIPESQRLSESASRLDLVRRMQHESLDWFAVVARDGLPIGIVGDAAVSRH